jgi:hypothetical protein
MVIFVQHLAYHGALKDAEVEDQLVLGGQFHGQVGGLGAFQDALQVRSPPLTVIGLSHGGEMPSSQPSPGRSRGGGSALTWHRSSPRIGPVRERPGDET